MEDNVIVSKLSEKIINSGYTDTEIKNKVGISKSTVHNIRNKKVRSVDLKNIKKLVPLFGMTLSEFFKRSKQREVISLSNSKGGVGKSTSAIQVGVTLADMGHNVLLIDNDPQGSLTNWIQREVKKRTGENLFPKFETNNIFELLKGNIDLDECIYNIESLNLNFYTL